MFDDEIEFFDLDGQIKQSEKAAVHMVPCMIRRHTANVNLATMTHSSTSAPRLLPCYASSPAAAQNVTHAELRRIAAQLLEVVPVRPASHQ